MVRDILTPMNHREIEYNAKKLSGCTIPDSFACDHTLLEWLDETGKRVFDDELVMDYGTDCLRLYLLFENTPREKDAPYYDSWKEGALEGIYKFLGKYRRMILVTDEWNRRGNYNWNLHSNKKTPLSSTDINKMDQALEDTVVKIKRCIERGNTMSNRHHIVSSMMELLTIYQKELKTGEIIATLQAHAIESAVPHGNITPREDVEQSRTDKRNPDVTRLCQNFMILMAPYAPDLSRTLWDFVVSPS